MSPLGPYQRRIIADEPSQEEEPTHEVDAFDADVVDFGADGYEEGEGRIPSGGEEEEEEEDDLDEGVDEESNPPLLGRIGLSDELEAFREAPDTSHYGKKDLVALFAAGFRVTCLSHEASDRSQNAILQYLSTNSRLLRSLLDCNSGKLPLLTTVMRSTAKALAAPEVSMEFKYRDSSGEVQEFKNQQKIPQVPEDWRLHYEVARVDIKESIDFHARVCPKGRPRHCVLSIDGVAETNSGGVSADILSIWFPGCRSIYPVFISRVLNKEITGDENYSQRLGEAVEAAQEAGLEVFAVVGDAVAIAKALGMKSHAAIYSCRVCEMGASNSKRPNEAPGIESGEHAGTQDLGRERLRKGGNVYWPYSSLAPQAKRRTVESMRSMADVAERGGYPQIVLNEMTKGMLSRSRLVDNDVFDVTKRVPVDLMHAAYIGVYDRILRLTFEVIPKAKQGVLLRRLPLNGLNRRILTVRVPSDFSRR